MLKNAWWTLVRFGFRLLYNELAFTYDLVAWVAGLGRWHDWQRCALKHLNVSPGARVLELAHGTGHLEIDLRRAGYRPTAIDLSRAMGRIAQARLMGWGWRPSLARAQAQALPFAAQRFDAVISTFPTEFIIDPATLAEVYRVLRPGGRLIVVFGGLLTVKNAAASALEAAYRVTGQRGPWPVGVEDRLKAAGFRAEMIAEELPGSTALLFVAQKD